MMVKRSHLASMFVAFIALPWIGHQNVAAQTRADGKRPNIVVIWGDDVGPTNLSVYSRGVMGYRTPNIDRIAREGVLFTDHYTPILHARPAVLPSSRACIPFARA